MCQGPYFYSAKSSMSNSVEHFDMGGMTHYFSSPLQWFNLPNNMHHYYYWTRGRIKMCVLLIIIACVTLTEHFLFDSFALWWFIFVSKIILIVASIIQCFYWMCMFWVFFFAKILMTFQVIQHLLSLFILLQHNQRSCGISFQNQNFQLTGWKQTKETNKLFCLSCFPSGLRLGGAFLAAQRNKLSRLTFWSPFLLRICTLWYPASNSGFAKILYNLTPL